MKKRLNAGMGEMKITDDPEVVLTALGLGSCVGVLLYERARRIAAMLHIVLPESRGRQDDDDKRFRFADRAIPEAIRQLQTKGANPSHLKAVIAGGAAMFSFGPTSHINIGQDNIAAVREQLRLARIPILAEDTGGNVSRTLIFDLESAQVSIKRAGGQEEPLFNLDAPSWRSNAKVAGPRAA